jgi:hypothetical protein
MLGGGQSVIHFIVRELFPTRGELLRIGQCQVQNNPM